MKLECDPNRGTNSTIPVIRQTRKLISAVVGWGVSQQAQSGAMPAGRNGPHNHQMTAVRNTAHWVQLFAVGDCLKVEGSAAAMERAASWLLKQMDAHCDGLTRHRDEYGKSDTNGLVGQAWVVEALLRCYSAWSRPEFAMRARKIVTAHSIDPESGYWFERRTVGDANYVNRTLNQQVWFTLQAVRVQEVLRDLEHRDAYASTLTLERVQKAIAQFISEVPPVRLLPLHIGRETFRARTKRRLIPGRRNLYDLKRAGYHFFALKGLAELQAHSGADPAIRRLNLRPFVSEEFVVQAQGSPFGYDYNVLGYELYHSWKNLRCAAELRPLVHAALSEQNRHIRAVLEGRTVSGDRSTLLARSYEAAVLL